METLDDALKIDAALYDSHWQEVDTIVGQLATVQDQISAWEKIAERISPPLSRGMPYFRLGVLRLLTDPDESQALGYLESAYKEDERYAPDKGMLAHRMGAYRLLALSKGFLAYLRNQKNWETEQLEGSHRQTLVRALLAVYDRSLVHILDMPGYTYQAFFELVTDRGLTRFAIENYFCAEHLLELFSLQGQHIDKHTDEYPLARAIVGLVAGVLEATLADRLPEVRGKTLGGLITEAHKRGIIHPGTKLGSVSSLMLYLRNHIHAGVESTRREFFIDINVAKGCKVALDLALNEMLQEVKQSRSLTP